MGRFGDDPHGFFTQVYGAVAPWDVGGPQPSMMRLLTAHPPEGPVLDVGSGTGDLAIHLASAGHEVVGVEFVERAVAAARAKAAQLPPDVARRLRFEAADATRPSTLGTAFGAVVDSGFLHLLNPDETERYVIDLAAALRTGGRYYVHAFAVEFDVPHVPRAITADEVTTRFDVSRGWRVIALHEAQFENRVGPPVPAIAACIERLADDGAATGSDR